MLILKSPYPDGGAPPSPPPVPLANLAVCYAANNLSLSDGDPVSSWPDSSGNNNAATASGIDRPTFHTGGPNGMPYVAFPSGTKQQLQLSTGITSQILHAWAVVLVTNGANPSTIFASVGSTPGAPQLRIYGHNTNLLASQTANIGSATATQSDNTWYCVATSYSTPTATFRLNGAADGTATAAVTFSHALDGLGINTGGGEPLVGNLAELLIYTAVQSGGDIATIEAYLRAKYALW